MQGTPPPSRRRCLALALALVAAGAGCQSMYYSTMEKFGFHKRDILVERVEEGRDAQQEAKTEIVDALEAFKALAGFEGGELESVYRRLSASYEASDDAVTEVKDRIESIEEVSKALFDEWRAEIEGMQDVELRRGSQEMLDDTRTRCEKLVAGMRAAEAKMEPVLVKFKDHVTFLKHNLNARAVSSLQKNLVVIESDVAALVVDMEKSIAEADEFIDAMQE